MSQERLDAALRFFFGSFLSETQRRTLRERSDRVTVRGGAYARYTGEPVPVVGGGTRQPRYAIQVGSALTMRDGIPEAGEAAGGESARRVFLLWLRDVADIVQDSAQEIERVMHNVNFYLEEGARRDAAAWAAAVTGTSNRSSLNQSLFAYTEVPAAFRELADSLADFRTTLQHFFTFTEDGDYYARWAGAGREVPAGLSDAYKEANVVEFQLRRYETYIYSVLPARFLQAEAGGAGAFREILWGFRWGEDDTPEEARVLHTVEKTFEQAGDFYDFVAFEAEEGEGAEMPVTARSAIDARLADFLQSMPEEPEARAAYVRASNLTTNDDQTLVRTFARISGDVQLPEGVTSAGMGDVRVLLVPPDKVTEVAALDQVEWLEAPRPLYLRLSAARPQTNYAALDARIAAAKRGGAGTVVGIIDSGLDAQNTAFAGRVLGVWNQFDQTGPTPASAFTAGGSGPVDAFGDAIANWFWGYGTEYTGSTGANAVANARDSDAHGTHVAGIAAGAAVAGANPIPAGFAPRAHVVAVESGRPRTQPRDEFSEVDESISNWDVYTAIGYILEKARRHKEGTPVVVNMSFGDHDHAHDGTAPLSLLLKMAVKQDNNFLPGRILVASCGNERMDRRHIQRTAPAKANSHFRFDLTGRRNSQGLPVRSPYTDIITIWVTNPDPSKRTLALDVSTRRPGTPTAVTAFYPQADNHTPKWVTFWNQGVHIGTSFGPPDPENKDFNIRIRFQTARALVPDPSGTVTIAGNNFRLVRVDRNWNINGTTTDVRTVTGAIRIPLGPTNTTGTPAAFQAAFATINGFTTARWLVTLRNRYKSTNLEYHVWAGRENAEFDGVTPADVSHLILSPADSEGVISVASCNAQLSPGDDANPEGALSSFSGPGPLRKRPAQPGIDITAPGCMITSVLSVQGGAGTPGPTTIQMAGSSMASPAIVGLVANIMAEEPTLTTDQIRARFATCAIPTKLRDGTTPMPAGLPNTANDWGPGLVDANKLKP